MPFRYLEVDEIECRVARATQKGVDVLLYKTARVDADILDEVVGAENWTCSFGEVKGTLFCKVGIRTNDGEWVFKEDAGAPSDIEREKGEASDAFKRACFKWGIGRELYSAPRIWIPSSKCTELRIDEKGKTRCYDVFKVAKILTEGGKIRGLRIVNDANGEVAYSWKEQRHE